MRKRGAAVGWRMVLAVSVTTFIFGVIVGAATQTQAEDTERAGVGGGISGEPAVAASGSASDAPSTSTTTLPPPPPVDGVGDSVVDLVKGEEPLLVYITANEAAHYCGITSYDAAGQQLELLVNTTAPFAGMRPIDFQVGQRTARLQVQCEGPWHIEFRALDTVPAVAAGETRALAGDDVFVVHGADTLTISGNAAGAFMGVHAYGIDAGGIDLLVNTVDPYQGEVIIPSDAVIVVQAEDTWSVTVNG